VRWVLLLNTSCPLLCVCVGWVRPLARLSPFCVGMAVLLACVRALCVGQTMCLFVLGRVQLLLFSPAPSLSLVVCLKGVGLCLWRREMEFRGMLLGEGEEVGLLCVGLSHLLFPCLTPPALPTACRCERG
jgi:hypothetical protein